MAPTYNPYTAIFLKLKDIFKRDSRTSNWSFYGAEYAAKKVPPCILIFPTGKKKLHGPHERKFQKVGLPTEVQYSFNLYCYVNINDVEDAYYSVDDGAKAGIAQMLVEVEAVLRDNRSAKDLQDSTTNLWFDAWWTGHEISNRPGKLMNGIITLNLIRKELE